MKIRCIQTEYILDRNCPLSHMRGYAVGTRFVIQSKFEWQGEIC